MIMVKAEKAWVKDASKLLSFLHYAFTDTTAAVSSSRGIEMGLSGATLDFAIRKLTCTSWFAFVSRR